MNLGEAVRAMRRRANLSQADLAREVYVTRQAVSRWETGETQPGIDMCKLIARVCGGSVLDLLGMPEEGRCQSCGMPFFTPETHGTDANGAPSQTYCSLCWSHGAFLEDETMDELIERMAPLMARATGHDLEDAVSLMGAILPGLERWRDRTTAASPRFKNMMLVVTDMDASVRFYADVLGLSVVEDYGENKVLAGGLALQERALWEDFIDRAPVTFGGNDAEAYFEAENFDEFVARLESRAVRSVHPVKTHAWGQRAVRFYDPDGHVLEVAEPMAPKRHDG